MERKLGITNLFRGDLGELIYEHYSINQKYAYLKTEEVYKSFTLDDKLTFRYGWERINVKVPRVVEEEIRKFAKPSNYNDANPSFVFDYLSMSLRQSFDYDETKKMHVPKPCLSGKAFNWIEIKTGNSPLSENQIRGRRDSKIGVCIFRIGLEEANLDKIKINSIIEK